MNGEDRELLLRVGRWDIRPTELRLSDGSVEHVLEAKVMDVLLALVAAEGQVVLREDLINDVWGAEFGGDESLTRAISLLRKALGDARGRHEHIRTVPRKGYQLIAPIIRSPKQSVQDVVFDEGQTALVEASPTPGVGEPATKVASRNLMLVLMMAGAAILLGIVLFGRDLVSPTSTSTPLVVIMDSAHPSRIYDASVRDSGGTNADILSDILSDLPVITQKELISPSWHRYEAMTQFEPDLILIHYSGFKQEDARGPRPQLKMLIEYFLKTDTKFLVYSRASHAWLKNKMDILLEDLSEDHPDIEHRVSVFPLMEYGGPNWLDQTSAQGVKLEIKEILELE